MASPIGRDGSVDIAAAADGSRGLRIRISEPDGISAEGLSLSTWAASVVLANRLHSLRPPLPARDVDAEPTRPLTVLELGAGTGLVGIAAAAVWGAEVTLTDLAPILPGIAANIRLNARLLEASGGGSASCGVLDWAAPSALHVSLAAAHDSSVPQRVVVVRPEPSSRPAVILAADTIYSEDHPRLLHDTISTWLARHPAARAIMCYPLRLAYIDHVREFWERMEAGGMECVHEGREPGMEGWNEIANTPYEWCVWRWKDL